MIIGIIILSIIILVTINLFRLGSIVRYKSNIKHINYIVSLFTDPEEVKVYLLFDYLYIKNTFLFYKEIRRLLKNEVEYFFSLVKKYCINYENTVHLFTTLFAIATQRLLYINYKNIIRNNLSIEEFIKYIENTKSMLNKNKKIDNDVRQRRLENLEILDKKFKEVIYNGS